MIRRITFQQVKVRAQKKVRCASCGKQHPRAKTFMHTINPYNVNADGLPKSYAEVLEDVSAEAEAWRREPVEPCRPTRGEGE